MQSNSPEATEPLPPPSITLADLMTELDHCRSLITDICSYPPGVYNPKNSMKLTGQVLSTYLSRPVDFAPFLSVQKAQSATLHKIMVELGEKAKTVQKSQTVNAAFVIDKMHSHIRGGWCQGRLARNIHGVSIYPSKYAVQFSLDGAFLYISEKYAVHARVANSVVNLINTALDGKRWATWNDDPERTKDDVLRLLSKVKEQADA